MDILEDEDFSKSIEKFLKTLNKIDINMEEVSQQSGISEHSLSDWRNGNSVPKRNSLKKLRTYASNLLNTGVSRIILKREFRNPILEFYREINQYLQEMKSDGKAKEEIIELYENNPKTQEVLEPLLDFGLLSSFIDSNNQFKHIDGKADIDRKLKGKYKENFIYNITKLIEFIDETSKYEKMDICNSSFVPNNLIERQIEELYKNIPHEEDFNVTHKISSVGEEWLQHNLNVSKKQVNSWKNGKDLPSYENLKKLKELVRREGVAAFFGYEFKDTAFLNMFLPSLDNEMENQEKEYNLNEELKKFTNMLFDYYHYDNDVKELIENVEISIKVKNDNSVASSFYNEIWNLKNTINFYYDSQAQENQKELKEYFNMSIESIYKTLEQDFAIIDEITTKENIEKLENYAKNNFDKYQKMELHKTIAVINDEDLYTIYTKINNENY